MFANRFDLEPYAVDGCIKGLPAVALVSYLINQSYNWYPVYLKIVVLVRRT